MIGKIIKLGIFLVIGIVAYNYFLGTPEEQQKSKEIIGKVSDIGKAGVGLLKGEYQKFKDGKYDEALDKIGDALTSAKEEISEKGGALWAEIESWQAKKERWEVEKAKLKERLEYANEEEKEALGLEIKKLNEKGEALEIEGRRLKEKVE